jgi:hypothetical protein
LFAFLQFSFLEIAKDKGAKYDFSTLFVQSALTNEIKNVKKCAKFILK